MKFDKEQLALLIDKAKGNRSINNYGRISGVDPGYISRLLRQLINSPPSAMIINKLADKAHNDVTVEELMSAAGYINDIVNVEKSNNPSLSEDKQLLPIDKLKNGRAFLGGAEQYTEEELSVANAAAQAAIEALRKSRANKKQ